ncbi:TPA: hypothetical protein N0F65_007468 [Lagenidium giganteum]|uniref:Biogenesis of lysosome-related organelles complex 1 subunit 7 n=1 Tax=Lagenidium giganteum TaxID=4803 RepID=A0AAV2ZCV9_9STRA|nr:TPA: hypothetical protein N0F65_007468 [Lagenidium giganteum]
MQEDSDGADACMRENEENEDPQVASASRGGPSGAQPEQSFAKGMHATLWPKVEKCHNYVAVLLAAQEQLQETVAELVAGLKEAEQTDTCSLVSYADRLKAFPMRVERLQRKLEQIEDRLLAMKEARHRGASCITKFGSGQGYAASPLF